MADTTDTKKLDSIIQIDGEPYEIIAKTAEKVAVPLTITVKNGTTESYTYDGSEDPEIEIEAVDHSGSASKVDHALTIKESGKTAITFDGSSAQEINLEPYALKAIKITAGDGLTGDGTLASNVTLNVGAGDGITVTADAVAAKAGNGITVNSTGINHAVPATVATNVTASGRTYITGITLDTYGHVTGLTTGSETVTNTATAADNILDGSNSGTQITYAPYNSSTATTTWVANDTNAGKLYQGSVTPTKTTRLNYNGNLYATKLYSGATEVLTKNTAITGAAKCKITYDTNGLVTAGADLTTSDIPSLAASKITAMTGYSKPNSTSDIAATDTLNNAIGKLEKALDGKLSSTKITVSQNEPTGGVTGDIWFKY